MAPSYSDLYEVITVCENDTLALDKSVPGRLRAQAEQSSFANLPQTPQTPSYATLKKKSHDERRRVLDSYHAGRDWREVVRLNGFKRSTAECLSFEGLETWCVNVTPAIKEVSEGYLNDCCLYTLRTLQEFIGMDFNVNLSTSTISRHLLDMLYTAKQVSRRRVCYPYVIVNTNVDPVKLQTRIETTTCSNECGEVGEQFYRPRVHYTSSHETTKERRKQFAEALRSHGRAKKGKRVIEKLPPTNGTNLQIQCAVSSVFGVVAYRTRRGSIKMQDNDDFVDELYAAVKYSDKIVVVFDNAPSHSQTETLVTTRDNLVLLRLGPYSPMCNPIENCFSVLKSHIKGYLALMRPEMTQAPTARTATSSLISMTEARMRLLERAVHVSMPKITQELVVTMDLHARDFVNAAIRYEDMSYGA
ncbi:Hypothetical protein PHPALM_16970 [Phytophthora palmivora]|uniref:Tc1-like transposase DDE domain-containing protein n=1 Tax=Phytophthora palmivora TaxID=4796 RepID=A0A2P4XNK2_9STRA|nr:Hypothetical protein PHPALM_16970 [Phytophthora palmivora]